jgi:Adenine specific DNA methylase Mod
MEKIDTKTPDITEENIEKLIELFPQVATEVENAKGEMERAIDFDALRDLLGDVAEGQRERYQFTWPGKRAAKAEARRPIDKTMIPCPEKSVDWDTTRNIFIEGDNLDALKLLRETYAGKINVIYLDPPYNTGSDRFIYPDNFIQDVVSYSELDGELDEQGNLLVENKESNGRFHSVWNSMLYERLLLLRDLMSADGLLAISINDIELNNLGKILDEVFGANNRLAVAPWRSEPSGGKDKTALRTGHEYILFYSKSADVLLKLEEKSVGELNLSDSIGPYKKGRELRKWGATSDRGDRPTLWFGITAPNGEIVYPVKNDGSEGRWRWSREKTEMQDIFNDPNAAHWELCPYDEGIEVDGQRERWVPFEKIRDETKVFGWNSWLDDRGTNADATAELKELFGGKKPFSTPKPTKLLQWIIELYEDSNCCTVLDIFAGAASTAVAAIKANIKDNGNRQFIMVQLDEPTDNEQVAYDLGFESIADVAEDRIRRFGINALDQVAAENAQLKLGELPKPLPDVGFRVLRVDSSNFKDTYLAPDQTEQTSLLDAIDNVKDGRTPEGILFQVLPAFRIPYSAHIEKQDVNGKTVFDVNHGQLLACFDVDVTNDVIEEIARRKPSYAVMRDLSFKDDSAAANFEELFKTFSPDTIRRVI